MDFSLNDDQRAIQTAARDFLSVEAGAGSARAAVDSIDGFDERLWRKLCGMGFAGLMVPEANGGLGLGAAEMALVLEETGRVLAPVPFFETAVLCVQAVLQAGTPEQHDALLPRLAAGARASFAGTANRPSVEGGRLIGSADFATFGHVADLIIVATRDESLIVLDRETPGLGTEPLPSLDRTRRLARLTFDCSIDATDILGTRSGSGGAIERTLTVGAGLLAAEQVGGMQHCLDSTVEYSRERIQFGRPIGSFQAYKHALADMLLLVEASRSAAYYAASAIDADEDVAEACHVARSYVSDAYRSVAGEAIQLHGGIGFTWEHHAHLYFKRARASASWLGSAERHREALARIILKDAA